MKYLPWLLLLAAIGFIYYLWTKPAPGDEARLKAAYKSKDSILELKDRVHDSLLVAQGEKILLQDQLSIQLSDYKNLKSKYDKARNSSRALDASGSIGLLRSWVRDSIPD